MCSSGRLAVADMLMVLDNCEHLIEPVAGLVQAMLERCPRGADPGDQPGGAGRAG